MVPDCTCGLREGLPDFLTEVGVVCGEEGHFTRADQAFPVMEQCLPTPPPGV